VASRLAHAWRAVEDHNHWFGVFADALTPRAIMRGRPARAESTLECHWRTGRSPPGELRLVRVFLPMGFSRRADGP